MNQEEQSKKLNQLIAKCWADDDFKKRLMLDTAATLKAEGMAQPAGMTMTVLENSPTLYHFVIPARLETLTDKELEGVAGGMFAKTLPSYGPMGPFGPFEDAMHVSALNPFDPEYGPGKN